MAQAQEAAPGGVSPPHPPSSEWPREPQLLLYVPKFHSGWEPPLDVLREAPWEVEGLGSAPAEEVRAPAPLLPALTPPPPPHPCCCLPPTPPLPPGLTRHQAQRPTLPAAHSRGPTALPELPEAEPRPRARSPWRRPPRSQLPARAQVGAPPARG